MAEAGGQEGREADSSMLSGLGGFRGGCTYGWVFAVLERCWCRAELPWRPSGRAWLGLGSCRDAHGLRLDILLHCITSPAPGTHRVTMSEKS